MTAPAGPVLTIDTASPEATIGVVRGDEVLAERHWTVETNYSRELLAGIDAALRDAGVARDELAAIAVDAGPGGYGGLRSGVATAQGLAFALDVPLAGVSRLELAAFPHLDGARPVVAVHGDGARRAGGAAPRRYRGVRGGRARGRAVVRRGDGGAGVGAGRRARGRRRRGARG